MISDLRDSLGPIIVCTRVMTPSIVPPGNVRLGGAKLRLNTGRDAVHDRGTGL